MYPGETVAKDPTVTLAEGSGDAYIRVKMEIDISDSTLTPNDAAALKANIDKEIAKSGKWYEATNEILLLQYRIDGRGFFRSPF